LGNPVLGKITITTKGGNPTTVVTFSQPPASNEMTAQMNATNFLKEIKT
jgi:hypothetical protein